MSQKQKIIVYNRLHQSLIDSLSDTYEVHFFKHADPKKDERFLRVLREAVGIIGLDLRVDAELLDQAPKLKIVSNVSVGYDNLAIDELTKRGIMATNTPDVLTDTVADAIFGLLIATARRMPELDRFVKDGEWKEVLTEAHYGTDVHHRTLGIIGMGEIGSAIAKRAHLGFDMPILYHNRSRKEEAERKYGATYCSLPDLLAQSDFVCLMTPLTPETEGLMGIEQFRQMKKTAIFINGSRGRTVVEEDLIQALREGEILAAGLDVFEQEPVDPDNPLLRMKNVVTLPHIGSSTTATEYAMAELAYKNLLAGLRGDRPPSLINEEVLKR